MSTLIKIILLTVLLATEIQLQAQQFAERYTVDLPDSLTRHELAWADFDNDSLLDIAILAETQQGKQFFICYKADTTAGFVWQTTTITWLKNSTYLLADADLDNDIDLIVSGERDTQKLTLLMSNNGSFTFTEQTLLHRAGAVLKLADLDEDGKRELVVSGVDLGQPFLTIYKNVNDSWRVAHDSLKIAATAIEVFDFDLDGKNDFIVSGRSAGNAIVSIVFYNQSYLYFKPASLSSPVAGKASLGDLNHDGYFDMILSGTDPSGKLTTVFLMNQVTGFRAVKDSLMMLDKQRLFVADMNSNGKCDLHFSGSNTSGAGVSVIVGDDGSTTSVYRAGIQSEAFGDYDRDGDIDIAQSARSGVDLKLILSENKSTRNLGPTSPRFPIAVRIFNRVFLYWTKPTDDHTSQSSLTYDVTLQTANIDWMVGEFEALNQRRLTVSHGNNGPKNYLLLKKVPGGPFAYAIQSIDNAFHTFRSFPTGNGGICFGSGVACDVLLENETIQACKNEVVRLQAAVPVPWFSFREGYMGVSTFLDVNAGVRADTLFSVLPDSAGCAAIKVFIVKPVENVTIKTIDTKYVCEGKPLRFGVESGWQKVEWSSLAKGFISNQDSILLTPLQDDTLKLKLSDGSGCNRVRSTALRISKPVVTLNGEIFQILKGEQVQLMADGGEGYEWTPPLGLSNARIASPIASPLQTTEYIVTVTDSIGCEGTKKILIMVEGSAFVPNLFTPNDDGKNDELRIYGLGVASNFTFTIHNREGSVVYETHDVTEATSQGWNGAVRGNKQPSGVYYWKIKGKQSSGRQLLLSGKSSGSIVLIR
jgi:gliding motility-associated-like protein